MDIKKEFEERFVAKYRTTGMDNWEPEYKLPISSSAEEVWQFIEEKLNNQKNELATSALGYLEYLQKDQHKVSLGSVKHDATVQLFIPEFFHKVFQRTPEEIEKSWKEYYQQGIDDFEQKLKDESTKQYLKGVNECEEKYVIPLRKENAELKEQLAEMTRLRNFWHKETQKEHAEMEAQKEEYELKIDYYQVHLSNAKIDAEKARAKAIDDALDITIAHNSCGAYCMKSDNFVTCQDPIKKDLQQLKEV